MSRSRVVVRFRKIRFNFHVPVIVGKDYFKIALNLFNSLPKIVVEGSKGKLNHTVVEVGHATENN